MSTLRLFLTAVVLLFADYVLAMKRDGSNHSMTVIADIEERLREMGAVDAFTGALEGIRENESDHLEVHAFNVGQANFIVLRRCGKAVIIDAGCQGSEYMPNAELCDVVLKDVEIVAIFLTHPHTDHFCLLKSLLDSYSAGKAVILLGGVREDWENTSQASKDCLQSLGEREIVFLGEISTGNEIVTTGSNYLADVTFKIFNQIPLSLHKKGEENKLSPLIMVTFAGKNMLFLGDAEGDSLSRFWRTSLDFSSLVPLCSDPDSFATLAKRLHECIDLYLREKKLPDDSFCADFWSACGSLSDEGLCPSIFDLMGDIAAKEHYNDFHQIFIEGIEGIMDEVPQFKELFSAFVEEVVEYIGTVISDLEESRKSAFLELLQEIGMDQFSSKEVISKIKEQAGANEFGFASTFMALFGEEIYENILKRPEFLPRTRSIVLAKLFEEEGFTEPYIEFTHRLIHTLAMRELFKTSHIVFLPHHGTQTKNSQNFLGMFTWSKTPRVFVVSSSPFGRDKLPKASTLDMAPSCPEHPLHYFLYSRDFSDVLGRAQLKLTNKPIYMTGTAPAGVLTFIIARGEAFILDLMQNETLRANDDSPWRWILLPTDFSTAPILDCNFNKLSGDGYYHLTFM